MKHRENLPLRWNIHFCIASSVWPSMRSSMRSSILACFAHRCPRVTINAACSIKHRISAYLCRLYINSNCHKNTTTSLATINCWLLVVTGVLMKIEVLWHTTPCKFVNGCWPLREAFCLLNVCIQKIWVSYSSRIFNHYLFGSENESIL